MTSFQLLRHAQITSDPLDPFFDFRASNAHPSYSTLTTTGGVYDTSRYGNDEPVPTNTAARPVLNTGGSGGQPYFAFDGVANRLGLRTWTYANFVDSVEGATLCAVGRFDTAAAPGRHILVVFSASATSQSRIALLVEADGTICGEGRRLDADALTQTIGPPADGQVHHYGVVNDYTAGEQRLYIDGVRVATATLTQGLSATNSSTTAQWGANGASTAAELWQGDGYKIDGYQYAKTDAEMATLAAAEVDTYGIQQYVAGSALPLTADGTSTTSGSADIATMTPRALTADGTSTTSGSAAIVTGRGLSATGAATSTGSAAINATRPLAATGQATSSGSAAIGTTRPITASGAAASSGSAAIAIARPLTASGASTTTGSAALTGRLALSATGLSSTTGSASTTGDAPLSGIGTATSSGSATIGVTRPMSASGTATSSGTAAVGVRRAVTASGSATSSGSAALGVRHALVADGTSLTVGDVEVGLALALVGDATTSSYGSASITLGGIPQYQPGTSALMSAPAAIAILAKRPAAAAALVAPARATAILETPARATATLTTEV